MSETIWDNLLSKFSSGGQQVSKECDLVFLGNNSVGSRTLFAKLTGKDPTDAYHGYAMQYDSLELKREEEIVGNLSLWLIENPNFSELLTVALPKERLHRTIVALTCDLSQPTQAFEQLDVWISKLEDHLRMCWQDKIHQCSAEEKITSYLCKLQKEVRTKERQQRLVQARKRSRSVFAREQNPHVQIIEEKKQDEEQKDDDLNFSAQLTPGVLDKNLGIPLIVFATKSDKCEKATVDLIPGKNSKQCFNFFCGHLRKWCLKYGATLIFTSAHLQQHPGVDYALGYIKHRMLEAQPLDDAQVTKPDSLFVPFGTDSLAKIAELPIEAIADDWGADFMVVVNNVTENKAEVKAKPSVLKKMISTNLMLQIPSAAKPDPSTSEKVEAHDHQTFLSKQLELMKMRTGDANLRKSITLPGKKADKSDGPVMPATQSAAAGSLAANAAAQAAQQPASKPDVDNDTVKAGDFFRKLQQKARDM